MKHENGSAMLWIFIGILLFAALGVAMMSGTRTSTGMLKSEEAATYAKQIVSYGDALKSSVKRLQFLGCDDTKIGFDNTTWTTNAGTILQAVNHNPNTPSDKCRVFNTAGGNMIASTFSDNGVPVSPANVKSGHSYIYTISVEGVGTSEIDMVMVTHYIDKQVCMSINDLLNIPNSGNDAPNDNFAGVAAAYNGSYSGTAVLGDNAPELAGHAAGCIHYVPGGVGMEDYDYHFYQVLIAR